MQAEAPISPRPPIFTTVWQLSSARAISLDRARIMAILNLTPDSFSDGGAYPTTDDAVRAAESTLAEGADLVDVGGESTRPGSQPVPADEQIRRTAPAITAIRRALGDGIGITIDTTLAAVALAALDAGADGINDVSAGIQDPGMLALAADRHTGIVLMHRLCAPETDRYSTDYTRAPDYTSSGGVVHTVRAFLNARAQAAENAGIERAAIVLDPGLGFGKSVDDNLALIRGTSELASLGYPILSGISRKSFTAHAAGLPEGTPPRARVEASVALSIQHYAAGARIFRVHDVAAHARALRTMS